MPVILVVGATGKQGGKAISTLLSQSNAQDLTLRFITRNTKSEASLKLVEQGCKAFEADLFHGDSLKEPLEGVDSAFLMTDNMVGEDNEILQGKTFIDAAKEAGVKHIVFTSVSASDTATSVPHFRSKYKIEQHLIASGLSYTILRPVAFMDNFPAGPGLARFAVVGVMFAAASWKKIAFIACEDIGVFAAKALLDPSDKRFHNQTIDLSAGEYGIEDVSEAIRKSQGYVPWLAWYAPSFIRRIMPYDFKQMFTFFAEVGYPPIDVEALKKIHPGLLSFEDWFRKNA